MSLSTTHRSPLRTDRTAGTASTVTAIAFAALVVVGQLYATIPLVSGIAREFGTTPDIAVWTSTVFGFAYAAGMLVSGPLSDVVGRRRIAVAGLLASAIAAFGVSMSPDFLLLLVTRAVQGAAAAFFAPVALAYLTERIAPGRRPVAVTTVISAFLAAAVIAPLAAVALAASGSWRSWFDASAIALVALSVVLWRVMLPDEPVRVAGGVGRGIGRQLAGLPGLLTRPRLVALYLATFGVMFAFVGATALAQLAGPGTVGHPAVMQWVRIATLPACVVVPLGATLLARLAPVVRVIGAMALVAAALAVTGLAGGPVDLTLGLGVVTIGVAATAPALVETVGAAAPPDRRGAAIALYGFTLFVGASLGAPAATALASAPFPIAAAVLAAIAAVGLGGAIVAARVRS